MPYVADPRNPTQPSESVDLVTAAAEFRAIKAYVRDDLLGEIIAEKELTIEQRVLAQAAVVDASAQASLAAASAAAAEQSEDDAAASAALAVQQWGVLNQQISNIAASFNIRTWAAGQTYSPGTIGSLTDRRDVVLVAGVWYIAAVDHTAGEMFVDDLAAGRWIATDPVQLAGDLLSTGTNKGAELVSGVDVQLADYTALRSYAGNKTRVYITGALGGSSPSGIAGVFVHRAGDTTSADNGGTVIVDGAGRRWHRDLPGSGAIHAAWFGVGPHSLDNTLSFNAAALTAKSFGGILELPAGLILLDRLPIYHGVTYSGQGIGAKTEAGKGTHVKMRAGVNPTDGFVVKGDNKASGWAIKNMLIDGNKAGNTSGDTIYIETLADGVGIGGENDEYCLLENLWVMNAPRHNITITGVGASGASYYNPRGVRINGVASLRAAGLGFNCLRLTDSFIDNLILFLNADGAINADYCANNYWTRVKGFYNGSNLTGSQESFVFINNSRSTLDIEAQEEYHGGIRIEGCTQIDASLFADANGFPSGSSVWGVQIKNTDASDIKVRAESFHAPDFKQNQPLYLYQNINTNYLNITVSHRNQNVSANYEVVAGKSIEGMTVNENGVVRFFSTTTGSTGRAQQYIGASPTGSNRTGLRHIVGGGSSDNFYLDVEGSSTTQKTVNFFRNTASTGNAFLAVFQGDGSGTATHRLNANGNKNAELCITGGGWNNGHLTLGAYRIWVDSAGKMRIKSGSPVSDTDGVVVGSQS